MADFESYRKVELAKACLVGMCANFEAPHHKPRELAAKALDVAQAFYNELDAREAANEAKEAEAGETEPPPAEDTEPESERKPVTADRPWTGGDLDREPQN